MKSFFARVWSGIGWAFRSTWFVPLLCLVLVGQWALMVAIFCGGPGTSLYGSWVLEISGIPAILGLPLLGLWFISSCFLKQSWATRGLRLLCAVLSGWLSFGILNFCVLAMMFQNRDHTADNWRVPEGIPFEVPENFWVEESAPDIVKSLAGKSDNSHARDIHPLPEGDFPKQTPHLTRLAQEHPELLRELWQRTELLHNRGLLVKEEDDPHGPQDEWYRCLAYLTPAESASTPSDLDLWRYEEQQLTTIELGKGWQLRMVTRCVMDREQERAKSDERLEGYTLQQLDAAFAELAANPTRETLDAMLPLPAPASLHLSQGFQPGIYALTLLLPKDARTDGHYEIRAYEYNTGEELSLDRDACRIDLTKAQDSRQRVWELDSARAWTKTQFMVYTGDWGQYYGSCWQVWFVPNKGEREMVCEHLFLMQGWMR